MYRDDLIMFLQANGMDASRIPGGVGGGGVVLCVGLTDAAIQSLEATVVGGRKVTVKAAADLFSAGMMSTRVCPKAVVLALHDGVSAAVAGLTAVRRVEGLEAVPGVGVGMPETTAGDTELAKQGGFTAVCQIHELPVTVAICIQNAPKPTTRYPVKKLAASAVIK